MHIRCANSILYTSSSLTHAQWFSIPLLSEEPASPSQAATTLSSPRPIINRRPTTRPDQDGDNDDGTRMEKRPTVIEPKMPVVVL